MSSLRYVVTVSVALPLYLIRGLALVRRVRQSE